MAYRFRSEEKERLAAVASYLAAHLEETVRMDGLCALAIMNRHKLNAGFERFYGQRTLAYLHRLRMEKARALLQISEESIGSIAATCGYQHQGSFSEAYKQYHGLLPREERNRSEEGREL
ncbi:MAG TPA: AraC family transcriptional regulator [Flavisolibacter sp.]|nr:AraC family transcriptional regulator [Flavisolibacter sp.]